MQRHATILAVETATFSALNSETAQLLLSLTFSLEHLSFSGKASSTRTQSSTFDKDKT